jgi:HAMP domain-containing protein
MDVISAILNADSVETLVLLVGMVVGCVLLFWQLDKKMNAFGIALRGEIGVLRGEMSGEIGKLRGEIGALREDMNALGVALRGEMDERFTALRGELGGEIGTLRGEIGELRGEIRTLEQSIDGRFTAFHQVLKENDFAHLNETIKALTFTLQKNKILEPEDKRFVDSHLENAVMT